MVVRVLGLVAVLLAGLLGTPGPPAHGATRNQLITGPGHRTVTDDHQVIIDDADAGGDLRTLVVERTGDGDGAVLAEGLRCGEDCSESYPAGELVRLMAYPADGSRFAGWASCHYTASTECVVVMSEDRVVQVEFARLPRIRTTITSSTIRPKKRKAVFEFVGSSSHGPVAFECRIDDEFRSCSSPRTYRRLRPGSHTFKVRAVDGTGAADPTPAAKKFVIRR